MIILLARAGISNSIYTTMTLCFEVFQLCMFFSFDAVSLYPTLYHLLLTLSSSTIYHHSFTSISIRHINQWISFFIIVSPSAMCQFYYCNSTSLKQYVSLSSLYHCNNTSTNVSLSLRVTIKMVSFHHSVISPLVPPFNFNSLLTKYSMPFIFSYLLWYLHYIEWKSMFI